MQRVIIANQITQERNSIEMSVILQPCEVRRRGQVQGGLQSGEKAVWLRDVSTNAMQGTLHQAL